MPFVLLGLALAGAVLVGNAFRPVRLEPFSVVSFFAGWLTGELALQHIVWTAGLTAGLAAAGALHGWAGWLGLGVATADWVALGALGFAAHRDRRVVAAALGGPGGWRAAPDEGGADAPTRARPGARRGPAFEARWFRWWRVALAVPFRGRTIARVKGIDYAGEGARRQRLDILWSRRHPPRDAPVLVQIHGGAWISGDKREQGIPLMHELAARGWVCVAVNYRLAPRATWPDEIVDCKRALAWVKAHIAEYGGDPSWVVVTGGSAGGHLSALVALSASDPRWQPGFEEADTSVAACVPFYGVYDMTGSASGAGPHARGLVRLLERVVFKADLASHRQLFEDASPLHRLTPDAPPFLVLHGANDTLVPVEEARTFVAALGAASRSPVRYVELPLAQHAFDILVSPRSWAAAAGAACFLEDLRNRAVPGPGRPTL